MLEGKPRIHLIGPIPPPYGGMSVQTLQLVNLLRHEGWEVKTIPVNYPFPRRLNPLNRLKHIRALIRLFIYLFVLLRELKNAHLIHIFSNSFLSFFFYTAPAVIIGKLYDAQVIVNYRGGGANKFLKKYRWFAYVVLRKADAILVPSGFLQAVFQEHGFQTQEVPNIIDLDRFFMAKPKDSFDGSIRLLVARNLEKVYNINCSILAFQQVQRQYPETKLTIIGEGTEQHALQQLVKRLNLTKVHFAGRVENEALPSLYEEATIVLNPSNVDNFPISVLEAFASGTPIVSTDVGGIPYLIQDGFTGLLVERNDYEGMAQRVLELLQDKSLYLKLSINGQRKALNYSWDSVRPKLFAIYRDLLGRSDIPL